jgi:hypothetical protein
MKAQVGDRLRFYSRHVDQQDRIATIRQVRGADGAPPYLVRFVDGTEALVVPGSDCVPEPAHPPLLDVLGDRPGRDTIPGGGHSHRAARTIYRPETADQP